MYFLGVIPKRVNEYFCTVKLVINFETLIKCAKNYVQRVSQRDFESSKFRDFGEGDGVVLTSLTSLTS